MSGWWRTTPQPRLRERIAQLEQDRDDLREYVVATTSLCLQSQMALTVIYDYGLTDQMKAEIPALINSLKRVTNDA